MRHLPDTFSCPARTWSSPIKFSKLIHLIKRNKSFIYFNKRIKDKALFIPGLQIPCYQDKVLNKNSIQWHRSPQHLRSIHLTLSYQLPFILILKGADLYQPFSVDLTLKKTNELLRQTSLPGLCALLVFC